LTIGVGDWLHGGLVTAIRRQVRARGLVAAKRESSMYTIERGISDVWAPVELDFKRRIESPGARLGQFEGPDPGPRSGQNRSERNSDACHAKRRTDGRLDVGRRLAAASPRRWAAVCPSPRAAPKVALG